VLCTHEGIRHDPADAHASPFRVRAEHAPYAGYLQPQHRLPVVFFLAGFFAARFLATFLLAMVLTSCVNERDANKS
jgi:hypothetical protein